MHACRVLCIIFCLTPEGYSWGKVGHFISSKIALSFLTDDAEDFLYEMRADGDRTLLESIMKSSIWPDSVSFTPAYSWSADMHFGTTPDGKCDGFQLDRDCASSKGGNSCTLTAIANYTELATDTSLPLKEQVEAVRFLIHFVADIHQPLHVGFKGDKGGTLIRVVPPWDFPYDKFGRIVSSPRVESLHFLWDSHILSYIMQRDGLSWEGLAKRSLSILNKDPNNAVNPMLTGVTPIEHFGHIANESSDLACRFAYTIHGRSVVSGMYLSWEYYEKAATVVMKQLTKSGIEIARLLNTIAQNRVSRIV